MPTQSNVIYGFAQKDSQGLTIWNTFTTTPQILGGIWYSVYKIGCTCATQCGKRIYNYDTTTPSWSQTFPYLDTGSPLIQFYYGSIPIKFQVLKNGVLLFDTGWGGDLWQQNVLDSFLVSQGLPPQTIQTSPPTTYTATVVSGDVLEIIVTNPVPQKSSYHYIVGCIGESVDCQVSAWSTWSNWVNSGNGTQTRTRSRTVVVPASNGGASCPDLTESQTQSIVPVNCQVSAWSAWSSWVDNGNNTESRTRTRTVIVPASNGGESCGPLVETETRAFAVDCVLSNWSTWSAWVDNGNGTEIRFRTRTVVIAPANGGQACGPTYEEEIRDTATDCVVSAWSTWSDWSQDVDDPEKVCRTRTRTILVPPTGSGMLCPELTETECKLKDIQEITVEISSDELRDFADVYIGDFDNSPLEIPSVSIPASTPYTGSTTSDTHSFGVLATEGSGVDVLFRIQDSSSNVLYQETINGTFGGQYPLPAGTNYIKLTFTKI